MFFFRDRRKAKADPEPSPEQQEKAFIPLPAETLEDTAVSLSMQRQVQSWVDEAYQEFVKNGGLEHLPGFGKPLEVPTGDVFETIMKNAKVKHPWIMLRQEIKQLMELTLELIDSGAAPELVEEQVTVINDYIKELNLQAPSLSLHRKRVTAGTLREQYEQWL
ncbi:DnaJ family domain-containing protein [Paenibacillus sp. NPDC056579]|uniref:DnaJ family domain-containing protein n=1 Tax=unclassified Paenibacillus TaxID=185978 RepID=UPI001EF81043|nr:DnaJ family domain-containing protein [Paenibacillus sp. H1-7]ULL19232.1 DUF1992 domain-containing protein [Paenibacillus sp. H1-7]